MDMNNLNKLQPQIVKINQISNVTTKKNGMPEK